MLRIFRKLHEGCRNTFVLRRRQVCLAFGVKYPCLFAEFRLRNSKLKRASVLAPFKVKGGDPAALSSTATLLRLHPPH